MISPILLFRSLDTVADVTLIYDRMFRLVYVNSAGAKLLGTTPDAAVGRTNAQLLGEQAAKADAALMQAIQSLDRVVVEQSFIVDGVERIHQTIFSPVPGEAGKPQFVIGISRDLSALRRAS